MIFPVITELKWNGSPEIFDLGVLSLRWYSLFFAAGFVLSYIILKARFKREHVSLDLLDSLTIYVVLGTVVGARLGHCLFYDFAYYKEHLLEIVLPIRFAGDHLEFTGYEGLASHGGAIGILGAITLFSLRKKVPMLWVLDKITVVVPLAGAFIRLGNFMNSEIIGKPSTVPWAVTFERIDSIPRHPAQLYEALIYFGIFLLLRTVELRDRYNRGFIFGLFLILTFASRFFVEFFKEDQVSFESSMVINMGQLLSIPFIVVGIIFLTIGRQSVHSHKLEQ